MKPMKFWTPPAQIKEEIKSEPVKQIEPDNSPLVEVWSLKEGDKHSFFCETLSEVMGFIETMGIEEFNEYLIKKIYLTQSQIDNAGEYGGFII